MSHSTNLNKLGVAIVSVAESLNDTHRALYYPGLHEEIAYNTDVSTYFTVNSSYLGGLVPEGKWLLTTLYR